MACFVILVHFCQLRFASIPGNKLLLTWMLFEIVSATGHFLIGCLCSSSRGKYTTISLNALVKRKTSHFIQRRFLLGPYLLYFIYVHGKCFLPDRKNSTEDKRFGEN